MQDDQTVELFHDDDGRPTLYFRSAATVHIDGTASVVIRSVNDAIVYCRHDSDDSPVVRTRHSADHDSMHTGTSDEHDDYARRTADAAESAAATGANDDHVAGIVRSATDDICHCRYSRDNDVEYRRFVATVIDSVARLASVDGYNRATVAHPRSQLDHGWSDTRDPFPGEVQP